MLFSATEYTEQAACFDRACSVQHLVRGVTPLHLVLLVWGWAILATHVISQDDAHLHFTKRAPIGVECTLQRTWRMFDTLLSSSRCHAQERIDKELAGEEAWGSSARA